MAENGPTANAAAPTVRFASEVIMAEFGRAMLEGGHISRQQLDEIATRKAITGESVDRALINEKLVDEAVVLEALATVSGIPFKPMADFEITQEASDRVSSRAVLRYQIMPVGWKDGVLTLAINEVPEMAMVDSLRMLLDCSIDWVLCRESDIVHAQKHFYGLGAESVGEIIEERKDDSELEVEGTDISADDADPGVIRFVKQVIHEAIKLEATDIHMEPFEDRLRLRYRIDGMLQAIPIPEGIHRLQRSIASCVKIMAQLNIAERRKPHDGRIKVHMTGDEFDLRVSVLPTRFGETVNMRILNRKAMFIDLEHLGLLEPEQTAIESVSSMPHGIVLITGPTGSGKTTTLYATLARINTDNVKIITVEDPIEYQMSGINQIQTHAEIGLTFAAVLRSILRHDPDIVLIGEIRDVETADIAVRAALTGHLVFSTLHTNDAPSSITRLVDMGIEPYLVSSCLEGVIAQRLVRRVCQSCIEETTIDQTIRDEIEGLFPEEIKTATFRRGTGCPQCSFTGYRGRQAIFEIMLLTDDLRSLIVKQSPVYEIRRRAVELGMMPLRHNGWLRLMDGVTTVEEVLRVAPGARLMG